MGPHRLLPSRLAVKLRYSKCLLEGTAAIAKVVVKPAAREDSWVVQEVGLEPQSDSWARAVHSFADRVSLGRLLSQKPSPLSGSALVKLESCQECSTRSCALPCILD